MDIIRQFRDGRKGWIGVDFDGVLVEYKGWNNGVPGPPIPRMVERVQGLLNEGCEVRIFTSRAGGIYPDQVVENCRQIQLFCIQHFKRVLRITNEKDQNMLAFFDDRAIAMVPNTGLTVREYYAMKRGEE